MTSDTSIGLDDPRDAPQSGIDDEAIEKNKREDGGARHDLTAEDIESGNDRNVSADDGGRAGRSSKDLDDAIELGK